VRILVVEDERNAARLLLKGLTEHLFAVDVASNGDQAGADSDVDRERLESTPGREGIFGNSTVSLTTSRTTRMS
jgi:hypothetical protein